MQYIYLFMHVPRHGIVVGWTIFPAISFIYLSRHASIGVHLAKKRAVTQGSGINKTLRNPLQAVLVHTQREKESRYHVEMYDTVCLYVRLSVHSDETK